LKKFNTLAITGFLVLAANLCLANVQTCAAINGGDAGGGIGVDPTYLSNQTGTPANMGCNVLITFGALGAITTTTPNSADSYDQGGDDNIIGIINNSGATILHINLSSTTQDIFNFDGDGVCQSGWTFSASGAPSNCTGGDSTGYGPKGISFTNITSSGGITDNNGTVNFSGGLANGASAYFALEGPVDLNHLAVPEPTSIVLFGSLLIGAASALRRRVKS
jgi:hypothetical protein